MGNVPDFEHAVQPKPHIVRLLEAVAALMDIDEGHERLELEFEDGYLCRWTRADLRNDASELSRYDELAAGLVSRLDV